MITRRVIFIFCLFFSWVSFSLQEQNFATFQDSIATEVAQLSDSLKAQKFYNVSFYVLKRLNDLELAESYADSSLYYAKISNFQDSEAKSYFQLGVIARAKGQYEKALDYLDKNIRYFKNDSTLVAYSLFQVGVIHRRLGDYKSSLKTYFEILDIFQKKKDSFAMASTLNSIGNIYGEMEDPDQAIKNFKAALDIFESKNAIRDVANAYENIGKMQLLKQDSLAAKTAMEQALALARKTQEDYQIARALSTLSSFYKNKDSKRRFTYLEESKDLLETRGFTKDLIPVYQNLADYYLQKKSLAKALNLYSKSLDLALSMTERPLVKDAYKGLSETHKQLGDFQKAINYQSQYIKLKDSLLDEGHLKTLAVLEKQFETEKKNAEINTQKLEIAEQNNQINKQRLKTNYALGAALVFLILSVASWLIFKQRQRRKNQELIALQNEAQVNALESLIEGEEKERLRIAKELHDGVNGDLSAIKHKLNTLLDMNNKTIEEALVMIDKSCEQVRAISHNLVPPALENFDLQTAASDYVTNMNAIHRPNLSFDFIGEDLSLPKIIEVNIFRVIQELITNSVKHANANEIHVQLSNQNDNLQLSVDDDGKGFKIERVEGDGVGLSNVKNRVAFLNGEVDISSSTSGTSVNIFMDKTKFNVN